MRNLLTIEGKFFTAMSHIFDMMIITLMWLVGCIPIVTILTSTSSLYHTTVKCIRYDRGKPTRDFIEAYKKNLAQGVPLTLLFGIMGAAIGWMDYSVFVLTKSRTNSVFILAVGMLILTAVYLLNLIWIIPVFSRFSNTLGNILKLNFVISFRNLIRSIPLVLVFLAAVLLVGSSLPLFIIAPPIVLLVNSYITEPALHKFMPKQDEDNGDWRYGFK